MVHEAGQTAGDGAEGADVWLPEIYEELRHIAHGMFKRQKPGDTLDPTALVNEAALKILRGENSRWGSPQQLIVGIAKAMKHILIDRARLKSGQIRGGGWERIPLDPNVVVSIDVSIPDEVILELEEVLEPLLTQAPRVYRVVVLRFFVGLTNAQIAEMEGVNPRTIERDWSFARGWLIHHLKDSPRVTELGLSDR